MKVKTIFLFHKVPLGRIAKNENLNEDMVDFLDHLQSLFVLMTEKQLASGGTEKVPVEAVFFGGDQLIEEWARNVQLVRSDGTTTEERLEGVWLNNEGWHAIRTAFKVRYSKMFIAFSKIKNISPTPEESLQILDGGILPAISHWCFRQ